jgi:hypothetical protein
MPLPHRRAAYNLPAAGHLCKRATDIFSKDSQPKWMFEHATHSLILPGDSRGDSWPSAFVWEFWEISIRTFVRITQPTMRFSIRRHSWEFKLRRGGCQRPRCWNRRANVPWRHAMGCGRRRGVRTPASMACCAALSSRVLGIGRSWGLEAAFNMLC